MYFHSVLESSTKVRVNPVPPSPESQEDEVDREDDEIYVAPGSQERMFLDEEVSDHPTDSQTVVLHGISKPTKQLPYTV
jgi:hypothetical protein